ncbi:MAG: Gfo/Idh/MocA family protein [Alphaproteobacteria bacterium]
MAVRLGIVGVGWWACFNHIPVALANAQAHVVAIADLDRDRLARAGDEFHIADRYADFHEMLAKENLDGVMIATPHTVHAEIAIAALQAGCHVLIEKPMATRTDDANAIVRASVNSRKQVLVPCGWNFRDYTAKAAEMIADGKIGTIRHVSCHMASALADLFAGEPMLETTGHLYRPPPSTWADPARAGGYGWGQMSHSLAWLYQVTGLTPQSGYCLAGKSPAGVDYFDAASVRMTNGATLALSGAATVPKHCSFQMDIRIFGDEGMILFDIERERLELRRHDEGDSVVAMPTGVGAYDGTLPVDRFIEICGGESVVNPADARNGAKVVATLDMLYRSALSGIAETAN